MSQGTVYIVFKNGIITLCQLKVYVIGRRPHKLLIFLMPVYQSVFLSVRLRDHKS